MQSDRESVAGSNIETHTSRSDQKRNSSGKSGRGRTKMLIACAIAALMATGMTMLSVAFLLSPFLGAPSLRSGRTQSFSYESLRVQSVPVKLTVGKPLMHYNMTVLPIYRPHSPPAGKPQPGNPTNTARYLSLGEALAR